MSLIIKCSKCGKDLNKEKVAYRVDKGSFGDNPIAHFLEDFKFDERIGFFCATCWNKMNKPEG